MERNAVAIGNSAWAMPITRPAWQRYLASVLLMAACGAVHMLLQEAVGPLSQVGVLYLGGVLVASAVLGLGPSLLAVGFGLLLTAWLMPPALTTRVEYPSDIAALALFFVLGLTIAGLGEWRRAAAAVARNTVEVLDRSHRMEDEIRLSAVLSRALRLWRGQTHRLRRSGGRARHR